MDRRPLPVDPDRAFWSVIHRALLMMASAIKARYL